MIKINRRNVRRAIIKANLSGNSIVRGRLCLPDDFHYHKSLCQYLQNPYFSGRGKKYDIKYVHLRDVDIINTKDKKGKIKHIPILKFPLERIILAEHENQPAIITLNRGKNISSQYTIKIGQDYILAEMTGNFIGKGLKNKKDILDYMLNDKCYKFPFIEICVQHYLIQGEIQRPKGNNKRILNLNYITNLKPAHHVKNLVQT